MSDADYQRIYKQQHYPTAAEVHRTHERNPEGASPRGLWYDVEFLRDVYDVNDTNKDTQFDDYHGHGWRSEERRVGNESVHPIRSRWLQINSKRNKQESYLIRSKIKL